MLQQWELECTLISIPTSVTLGKEINYNLLGKVALKEVKHITKQPFLWLRVIPRYPYQILSKDQSPHLPRNQECWLLMAHKCVSLQALPFGLRTKAVLPSVINPLRNSQYQVSDWCEDMKAKYLYPNSKCAWKAMLASECPVEPAETSAVNELQFNLSVSLHYCHSFTYGAVIKGTSSVLHLHTNLHFSKWF